MTHSARWITVRGTDEGDDYQDTGGVSFDDGHLYWVAAVDDTSPLCHTGRPDEAACVYATPARNFAGDDAGAVVPWTVT